MLSLLGWLLLLIAAGLLGAALRRPAAAPGSRNPLLWGGAAGLLVGAALVAAPSAALAPLRPVDLSHPDDWRINPAAGPAAPVHWEGGALVALLESGRNRYAAFPVDWRGGRFSAAWDMTVTRQDLPGAPYLLRENGRPAAHRRGRLEMASFAVGMLDQTLADLDDRDHVSGSGLEACFSDDVRLRASDANLLVRTDSATETGRALPVVRFRPSAPAPLVMGRRYHCELAYDGGSQVATLTVRGDPGRQGTTRRLEGVKDLPGSVAWFGITIRGDNRYDKKLDARKDTNGYPRPRVLVRLENLRYAQ